ncbi:MAG TPA: hypothetical protein VGK54_10395 [Chloroflexota bacterium]
MATNEVEAMLMVPHQSEVRPDRTLTILHEIQGPARIIYIEEDARSP